jgi:hypothetical protein
MAICEQGYLCDLCGEDVEVLSDSDLYLRYVLGEVPPEELHRTPERHIRCNPVLAQFIVADGFEPLAAPGFFDKAMLDPEFVAEEEARVSRGYLRLVEIAAGEVSIVEYPLPEVLARWREAVAPGEPLAARQA